MRKYAVCFYLMFKRILKTPAFVFMLFVMLVIAAAVSMTEQGEKEGTVIGIVIEQAEIAEVSAVYEEWKQDFTSQLNSQEGILQFRFYENKDRLIRAVERNEADCGFIVPYDLKDMLTSETWRSAVTVYISSSSALTQMAKEKISAAVFTLYSEESYVNYIKNSQAFAPAQTGMDDNVNNDKDNNIEEIVDFAKNAYESHLIDGSTFDFVYNEESNASEMAEDDSGSNKADISVNDNDNSVINSADEPKYAGIQNNVDIQNIQNPTETTTFRLRGVLAVCIFISGMCGLLTDWKDRHEKRFLRIAPPWTITLANVWIPTIYTSAVSYAVLLLTGQISGGGNLLKELLRLLIYQFLIVIYCSIIRLALKKQETIAAAIPILTLACIICCPVWIRLATYVPVFRVLEKLFPATYYLIP
ncbi:MAG: hypothetical protein NC433_11430 [Clostridiales bacterium]|nr:hypothetical protein [Clostridiales bacterium]